MKTLEEAQHISEILKPLKHPLPPGLGFGIHRLQNFRGGKGLELLFDFRNAAIGLQLHQQVQVIRHQAPGINDQALLGYEMIKRMDDYLFVNGANEDIDPVNGVKGQEKAWLLLSRMIVFTSHTHSFYCLHGAGFAQGWQMLFQFVDFPAQN